MSEQNKYPFSILITALLLSIGFSLGCAPETLAEPESKVLILPFNIHSDKDLSFLKNGIQDMLGTRLTKPGKLQPISKEAALKSSRGIVAIDEKTAGSLGEKMGADYVVFGSLTVFGDSISTDARLLDTGRKKILLSFNESGKESGDVIAHIDRFAGKVDETLFGGAGGAPAPPAAAPKTDEEQSRMHPESLWTGKVDAEDQRLAAGETGKSALGGTWKSRNFDLAIEGMDIGDVNGDGKSEVVFMTEKSVFVYRQMNDRFLKIAEIEGGLSNRHLSINVADINGNGVGEIFVTNLHKEKQTLLSYVLEWDGTGFRKIVENARWYFRVVEHPQRGKLLMGQQRDLKRPFSAGVTEMNYNGTEYAPAMSGDLPLPRWVNVFGFAMGDVTNTGQEMTAAFSERNYLRVLTPDNEKEWESEEPYIAGGLFIEYPDEAAASIGTYREQIRYYLPQRIVIADVDKDGKNEVLVCKNKDAADGLFAKLRLFKAGQIECLSWDQFGLYPKWKTRNISGHVSDFAVGDIDDDGRPELVFAIIKSYSSVMGAARSFIASQDILPAQEIKKTED
ncbi:FG-GAP-like repeat-containing protein [Desulfococcus sp.]|uniref:FG-GAP-like repeat-containing protein n=1 Tax=Desulfococcus sp. TaxID=2025834 RepID=UPI003593749E